MKKILLASVMMCPAAIWAQDIKPIDVKAGLWETNSTTQISGIAMPAMPQLTPEQLAQMPPEARARIEGMMKGAAGSPRTTTTKSCITKEQLSKPMFNSEKSCTYKLANSSSSMQQIHVECATGNTKTVGDLTLQRIDSEHTKGDMTMKASGDGSTKGAPQNMTIKMSMDAKWLGADCGSVEPINGKQ